MRALSVLVALFLCAATPAFAAPAAAAALLYERVLMVQADRRCRLFTPAVAAALDAAALQARSAAGRSGQPAAALDAVEARAAAKARSTACGSPDLAVAAERVRTAYEGWTRMPRMAFPGAAAEWRADRTWSAEHRWRLVQNARLDDDPLSFGLAVRADAAPELLAVARFDPRRPPVMARLTVGGRVFLAESRHAAPKALRPARGRDALAFRFSPAAAAALEQLEARDTVRLEFVVLTRSGESVRSTVIEVGDFAAARVFLLAAAR